MNERIKQLRKELGLTQQQFADNLKIARGNIAAYEVGKNSPSDAVISLICREFDVNEVWLREGSGNMFKSNNRIDPNFLAVYSKLNAQGKEKACELIELLAKIPDYTIN